MDLTEFLTARLDEDEAVAKAATPGPWHVDAAAIAGYPHGALVVDTTDGDVVVIGETPGDVDLAHIARHDPARTLREVEAGRKLLAWYAATGDRAYLNAIRAKAAVYSDHPDHDPLWVPPE